ncbi:MAG: hypothetical protein PHW04_05160 [Candidatus Wallbacteria bacterium]|nr:hypothetical protein [Candidatus Wallbacteria bacterium]
MSRVVGLMVLMLVVLSVPAFASDMDLRVFNMVHQYWNAVDAVYNGQADKADTALNAVEAEATVIAEEIIAGMEAKDFTLYKEFVAIYNQPEIHKAPEMREPLNLIAGKIYEYQIARDYTPDTYFPGFGYAEPGFVYRKGEELSREVLSVYWKKIDRILEKGKKFSLQLEVGAAASFGGSADVVQTGTPISMNVDGHIKEVVQCEITVKETIHTICTIKFQKVKVFFNLYKAEKSWWGGHGDWSICGKTYEMQDEESGLQVVEVPGTVSARADYYPGYGYADPAFNYKKGEEINSEILSVNWRKITKTLETGSKTRVLLEVGAEVHLSAGLSIAGIGDAFKIDVGGTFKWVKEYEITSKESTTFEETVKYQQVKTWVKLYKQPKGSSVWTECGKTYDSFEEPSGLPVVEIPGNVTPK